MKTGFRVKRIDELAGDLPRTRLFGIFKKETQSAEPTERVMRDDPNERMDALYRYDQWYWVTLASLRKKFTHWFRQRA